jgi:divinyl protochlorophyllide a 8-vinyl-reductase
MGPSEARVGPNAIIQLEGVISKDYGTEAAATLLQHAGLQHLTAASLQHMVRQEDAQSLFRAVSRDYPADAAARIMHDAGIGTAEYLLANRIPGFAKALLKFLPPSLAARLLLLAIGRHAWTFAGSGTVVCHRKPLAIEILSNPLAISGCLWHQAIFERLFRELVSRKTSVRQVSCCVQGSASCRFEIALQ